MKLIALISWYDESPSWLSATVASIARCCEHVIAVDGVYALYPGALERPYSGTEQSEAIIETARGAGIGCTLHLPVTPWYGNEVEKRNHLFRLAETIAEPDDWYFPIDADEIVSHVGNPTPKLQATDLDVAEIQLWQTVDFHASENLDRAARTFNAQPLQSSPHRQIFRAIPGLHVTDAHWHYCTPDGTYLWGPHDQAQALDLTQEIKVEHRHHSRTIARSAAARAYYKRRDELHLEAPAGVAP